MASLTPDRAAVTAASVSSNLDGRSAEVAILREGNHYQVVVNGARKDRYRRRVDAIAEMFSALRRALHDRHHASWGLVASCDDACQRFTFAYGNAQTGHGGQASQYDECVRRAVDVMPETTDGFGAALAHAEQTLRNCCRPCR